MIMIIVMLKKPCSTIPCSSLVGFSLNLGFYTLVILAPGHHHDHEVDDHDNNGMIRILMELIMVVTDRRTLMCWGTPLKT